MQKITFYGWRVGMRKGAFTHLLKLETGLGLKEARTIMLQVLDGQSVTLELPAQVAALVLEQADLLGVKCRLG